jgi:hypothetical protein
MGHLSEEHLHIEQELETIKLALGKHEARAVKGASLSSIQEAEFKVFSQFGEDGIIQYLISKVPIENQIFIELGVGDYSESNTRFLLMNNNWKGIIVNTGTEHIEFIHDTKQRDFAYRYDINAISAFINKDNVNNLIRESGVPKDIGLLSLDIDSNDYWIWEAITTVSPRIFVVEYNSTFGPDHAISVPYKPDFDRTATHYSNLYFGASLQAFCLLAKKKGYQFVGSNSAGVNAFFVRQDVVGQLPKLTAKEGYVANRYRESRGPRGEFTYISDHDERRRLIKDMNVVDIRSGKRITIGKLFGIKSK